MLIRQDGCRLTLPNPQGVEVTVFAREDVPIERKAVQELARLLELQDTVERLPADFFGGVEAGVERVAVTPDFHKGAGVPIGTVLATRGFLVPQAIGNDINCGMRVHTTGLTAAQVTGRLDELEKVLRWLFFEGGRNLPMTRGQREALFTRGLEGLLEAVPRTQDEGGWALFHRLDVGLERIHGRGSLPAERMVGLADFLTTTRDDQLGSIGGGNHFVELQTVESILDGTTAHAWGLRRGQVVVMVHTGSVGIGHLCGALSREAVRGLFPAGVRHPENGIFVLPQHAEVTAIFRDALHNAANFAFANRMFLALTALHGLFEVCGEASAELLYDAPHNLVWEEDGRFLHRKGACPARGLEAMQGTPFAYHGEPVLVPGSMGASSFLLAGLGNAEALCSASHGAGRQLSRGQAVHADEAEFREFLRQFRVVTPVDFRTLRSDILAEKLADLKQEAPFAYKGIGPIIRTLEEAAIARPVAELRPLLTVKG